MCSAVLFSCVFRPESCVWQVLLTLRGPHVTASVNSRLDYCDYQRFSVGKTGLWVDESGFSLRWKSKLWIHQIFSCCCTQNLEPDWHSKWLKALQKTAFSSCQDCNISVIYLPFYVSVLCCFFIYSSGDQFPWFHHKARWSPTGCFKGEKYIKDDRLKCTNLSSDPGLYMKINGSVRWCWLYPNVCFFLFI